MEQQLWANALAYMLDGVEPGDTKNFFLNQLKPLGYFNDTLLLVVENKDVEPFIRSNYLDEITNALRHTSGRSINVQLLCNPDSKGSGSQSSQAGQTTQQQQNAQYTPNPAASHVQPQAPKAEFAPRGESGFTIPSLNFDSAKDQPAERPDWSNTVVRMEDLPGNRKQQQFLEQETRKAPVPAANAGNETLFEKCTFENFVVGESNEFAHGAAIAVAESPGTYANPLFIYGKSGLGKTHLMVSIANYIGNVHPNMYVRYTTASDFMKTYVSGLQNKNMEKFDSMFLNTDVLLVDDVQYLENKEETINQLFDIFNTMVNQDRQVVLTADRAPKDIKMDDRMRSRFMSGLLADVRPPDFETRLAIIKNRYKRAQEVTPFNSVIPDEVLNWLAENTSSNIREMEGAVMRLFTNMNLTRKETMSIDEAKVVLQDFFPSRKGNTASIAGIQQEVEHFYNVSHDDLIGPKRSKDLALARHIAIYLCRYNTEESLEAIGRKFGGRDHTTVMYSVNKIEEALQDNRALYDQITNLEDRIKDGL